MFDIDTIMKQSKLRFNQQQKDAWDKSRKEALAYYNADTEQFTIQRFSRGVLNDVPLQNNNITKRIIDRISVVYSIPAQRDVDNDSYKELTGEKNASLGIAEKRLNLLNMVVLKVSWRNDQFEYDTIIQWEPHFAPGDPLNPIGISYPITASDVVTNTSEEIWEYVDADTIVQYFRNSHKILKQIDNPNKVFPFVFLYKEKPQQSYTKVTPANDLIASNETINILQTDLALNMRLKAFGIPYIIGLPENGQEQLQAEDIGPRTLMKLPDNVTEVGQIAADSDLTQQQETIDFVYLKAASSYHLDKSFVEGANQAESGVSLKIRNIELSEFRIGDLKLWQKYERQIYAIERVIAFNRAGINLGADFSVDFHEKIEILTEQERLARNAYDLDNGFTTRAKILFRSNPDGFPDGLEQAQAVIDENIEQNKQDTTLLLDADTEMPDELNNQLK